MTGALIQAVRTALAGRPAWLVGGAIRDELLGRATEDFDIVLDGDVERAARAIARAGAPAAAFALSDEFGAWRVVARSQDWQVDIEPLHGGAIEQDLALRDLTINAIARPLGGGGLIDPLGGRSDLEQGLLRATGPNAFLADPLRVLRLIRLACELEMTIEPATLALARDASGGLASVSPERIFLELRRIIASSNAVAGLRLLDELGAEQLVFPELGLLRGVEQSRFHHLDVYEHTLAVLAAVDELDRGMGEVAERFEPVRDAEVRALLSEPLGDTMTRGEALRWGALLHDIAKPQTAGEAVAGRVTFVGHDELGAEMARRILTRLRASERTRAYVAALTRHHLRLGFLVHEPQPLGRRTVYRYLHAVTPVEADVTLLSVCDRLATRGDGSQNAIAAHLAVALQLLPEALRWRAQGPPRPPLRGDELAVELEIPPGPQVGRLLELLVEADWSGEIRDRDHALATARTMLETL